MDSPKASIIITAHNYADYLPACLDSALNQTYDDYEIIVVDDGSTDETSNILREYKFEHPDTIRCIRLEGQGLPGAANAGIEIAEGEYVVRLDGDDMFDENILTVEINYLESNPQMDLVYPDYYTVDADGDNRSRPIITGTGRSEGIESKSAGCWSDVQAECLGIIRWLR